MTTLSLTNHRRTKRRRARGTTVTALLLLGGGAVGIWNAGFTASQPAPRRTLPVRPIWKQITFPSDLQTLEESCREDPTMPPGTAPARLPECVCEDARTKSGDDLSPRQKAECTVAEAERIALRNCGFIELDKDFYACACPLFRVRRRDQMATRLGPEEMSVCLQQANQQPPPPTRRRPASAQADVLDVRAGICSVFAGGLDRHPRFDATLEWSDNGVQLGSDAFSCSLVGPPGQMVGAANCNFMVGGGRGRTPVVCPAARINGQRNGDTLHLTAFNCSGHWTICDVSADIDVRVTPTGP